MRRKVFWSVAAGAAAVLLLVLWRGFFWQHALMVGLAVTALVYSTFRTLERMRGMYR